MKYDFDIIIVGGGPAGATCALYAARSGLDVLLVDKHAFPRDKICGDAIPGNCNDILHELGLFPAFIRSSSHRIHGAFFSSPNEETALIRGKLLDGKSELMGYTCRRIDFDNLLFQAAKKEVETIEHFNVKGIFATNGQAQGIVGSKGNGQKKPITAKVIVGADGFKSVVARKSGLWDHDPDHWVVATRGYYKGIDNLDSLLEVHLIDTIIPGYFWIFPLTNDMANVGIGMIHRELKKHNLNLREAHIQATQSPLLHDRFKNAELLGEIKGSNLPLGSKKRKAYGDGFLLLGDAAGLIDPFTGEGLGNAMHSGKIAAQILSKVCKGHDFSSEALKVYQEKLWAEMGETMSLSYKLQRLLRFKALINLMVKSASRNTEISNWIFDMLVGRASKKAMFSPATYWKLLNS